MICICMEAILVCLRCLRDDATHSRIISTTDVHKRKRQISAKNRYLKN